MSLYPHQHDALVERLKDLKGLAADEAFALLVADKNFLGLRLLGFVTKAKYDRIHPKNRSTYLRVVSDKTAEQFPTGTPGFPNKLRREWFDAAWKEAKA